ncbi:hypothetical protein CN074_24985 [Sinorhizobium medicae]|uniref:hypothetical protein n=1 Tax=Sinorhizobium medicae TaxID=110321 RepID=UPI000FD9BE95|nr:hypothetical protein [Sinorhizobium medicae]RVH84255.1 hypothetical protein CN201_26810 [Sinorhizobium medicae]RVP63853.1 hypothetical protein CN074_24985 [Sinorhizobium medicae]
MWQRMTQFVTSPELITLKNKGTFRLTQQVRHEDFSVWEGSRILAQGGRALMERVFTERTS